MELSGLIVHSTITDIGPTDAELQLALVRITQEALANVIRHRGPGDCWVDLRRSSSNAVILTIDDDGCAPDFDRSVATDRVRQGNGSRHRGVSGEGGGSGIIGMTERARATNGTLDQQLALRRLARAGRLRHLGLIRTAWRGGTKDRSLVTSSSSPMDRVCRLTPGPAPPN